MRSVVAVCAFKDVGVLDLCGDNILRDFATERGEIPLILCENSDPPMVVCDDMS
jgi:hypothetical protein